MIDLEEQAQMRQARQEQTKSVPSDIAEVYSLIKTMINDLTDLMAEDAKEWLSELRNDVGAWRNDGGKEPDWDNFRSWMNEICSDDGMPHLFEEV